MSKNLVIIPTYNEKENIKAIIHAVLDLPREFEILIIEDNSPDGTADIVKGMMKEHPGLIHIIERKGVITSYSIHYTKLYECDEPTSRCQTAPSI